METTRIHHNTGRRLPRSHHSGFILRHTGRMSIQTDKPPLAIRSIARGTFHRPKGIKSLLSAQLTTVTWPGINTIAAQNTGLKVVPSLHRQYLLATLEKSRHKYLKHYTNLLYYQSYEKSTKGAAHAASTNSRLHTHFKNQN